MVAVSPAEVLAALLVQLGLATRSATSGNWPVTTSSMPDDLPDNRISIYNTGGDPDAKNHRNGETLMRPECQIRVRSKPASDGYIKAVQIMNTLSPLSGWNVTINTTQVVTIVAITIKSAPTHMGQEEKNQRQHHTLNVSLSIVPGA